MDEEIKSGVYLADKLLDPKTATSQEPLDCPFSRAFGHSLLWDILESPKNEYHLQHYSAAMHGSSIGLSSDPLLTGILHALAVCISGAD
jgi:hypothetical protein